MADSVKSNSLYNRSANCGCKAFYVVEVASSDKNTSTQNCGGNYDRKMLVVSCDKKNTSEQYWRKRFMALAPGP